jgi:MYXO-CTERM domain-containing protein
MKICVTVAIVAGCAVSASALVIPADQVSVGGYDQRSTVTTVHSAMTGPFAAFPSAPGALGFEDYDSIEPGNTFPLAQFAFVGSLVNAGTVRGNFYTAAAVLANSFDVNLPASTGTIYTVTLGANNGKDSTFIVPSFGFVELVTVPSAPGVAAAAGRWFLSPSAPTIGTQSAAVGSTAGSPNSVLSHRFELRAVPTPGALALLGLGGLVAARRRR